MNGRSGKELTSIALTTVLVLSVFVAMCAPVSANGEKEAAIEKGLEWLADQQDPATGAWNHPDYYPVASTAFAVLKFEHHAKEILGIDPFSDDYEYKDNIVDGLRYIFNNSVCVGINMEPAGDPDVNLVNDQGIYFISPNTNRPVYETGIVMMALEASCHPEFTVGAPGSCIDGWTYLNVMNDTVDYVAWAQNDDPNVGRGGWRYGAYDDGAMVGPGFGAPNSDNSISQWPVLGLMSAAGWDVYAPDWVATELEEYWLDYSQNLTSGCFGYAAPDSYTSRGPVAVTAAGLTQLTYCGVTTDDDRWVNASRCICENWNDHNIGHLYAMYGVMKASMTAQPEVIWWYNCSVGEHEWQPEYDAWLIAKQRVEPDYNPGDPEYGSWTPQYDETGVLTTEWALLILQKVAPCVPSPAIEVNKTVWDPDTGKWVKWIDADVCDTVRFNCTIHNNGTCCNLTNITVWDWMSDSLEYANDATHPESYISPDKRWIVWRFPDRVLEPCESISIEFDARVVKDGMDVNVQGATAWYEETMVSDEDAALVRASGAPDIEVDKMVWDTETEEWVDVIDAYVCDTVRFNCTIHNNGTTYCNLTNITVWDVLSESLEYANDATHPESYISPDKRRVEWEFPGLVLEPCESISIEFNAHVVKAGVDVNTQNATAWCEEAGVWVSDEDTAIVIASHLVPAMSPIGIAALIGLLGLIGAGILMRRK